MNKARILVIDCGSSKVPMIEHHLLQLNISFNTIKLISLNNTPVANGIIISGAPILLTETNKDPFLQKAGYLFTTPIPILGICFGHQLMGLHHNAEIYKCKEDRDWQKIELNKPFDLLPMENDYIYQMEDHCEAITLPTDFDLIGSSVTCPNEIMKHKVNPWYGVQFHPEASGEVGRQLIANFVALCN